MQTFQRPPSTIRADIGSANNPRIRLRSHISTPDGQFIEHEWQALPPQRRTLREIANGFARLISRYQ